ncbi:MAG: beta-lactamase family protein, partial [Deltaproteobacteria bacterium]|nr:beta-lactamase family protein [Deltaproteobacteria bacterium]
MTPFEPAAPERAAGFLEEAVREGVFPGAVLIYGRVLAGEKALVLAGRRGLTRNREPAAWDLIYDLASLTKILSTGFLVMQAVTGGRLSLEDDLKKFGWSGWLGSLKVIHLLSHQSGLAPWRPLYRLPADPDARSSYKKALEAEEPSALPGRFTVYSDLNFLILGFILEELYRLPLGQLFEKEAARPLNLLNTGYCPQKEKAAPTEDGPRSGGPLDYPGVPRRGPVPLGRVHDDNAAGLGGAGGQAGLFGPAGE